MKKREYRCKISKRVCPFNDDDTWEWGGADSVANDNCPIGKYQNGNRMGNGVFRISDWCAHLIPRKWVIEDADP